MKAYVRSFESIDGTMTTIVGGKAAHLGELIRIKGIHVPEGFCVTTDAYKEATANNRDLDSLLDQLGQYHPEDRESIGAISAKIRDVIEGVPIVKEIRDEIVRHLTEVGEGNAFAVRSSATAEDLPTASFAGQQDSYLNIAGRDAILKHISKCWASLFTERAVIYRMRNGFDHRKVYLSVVVQKLVFAQVSGILFTADPVNSNRKVSSIDAGYGLGEALVGGLVNADSYKVRDGKVVDKSRNTGMLTDEQVLELERIGRRIEAHFGLPQDIEWCLVDNVFYIVQSRPITTLYPIPEANDRGNHVYISVGHQQMMTDAIKPLGLSFFQLTAARPMHKAGGRLFVDVTADLASPRREMIVDVLGKSDPLIRGALMAIIERDDFIKPTDQKEPKGKEGNEGKASSAVDFRTLTDYDPAVVPELMRNWQIAIDDLKESIRTRSGPELIDFILEDIGKLRKSLSDPKSFGVIMTAINASTWINEKMKEWLGEKNAADTLSQSVSHNITSEMGLELLDVADAIRPYPEVIAYLKNINDDGFLDGMAGLDGGQQAKDAIQAYLGKYGMRCVGEIDITKARWAEKPIMLVPLILSNIRNVEPNASDRRFQQGQRAALKKEGELLDRLKQLPDGEEKTTETKRMIDLVRNLIGYREYPKYHIVSRYFAYKQALLKEAEQLVQANVMLCKEDIFYLSVEELREVMRSKKLDYRLIDKRKEEYKFYEKLSPPRIITSDGEIITGEYKREGFPAGAIVGLAVSSGMAEGRARVILKLEDADLEEGDILVTSFTDPSWTPLFVSISGLVTEVGGLMTHGAVIAREYGLPAVVGVENATRLITDGQRIRVHGTEGYVEILPQAVDKRSDKDVYLL